MKPAMAKSFVLYLVVGVFVAYLASVALDPGASYLSVFQVTGTAAFMAYGFIGYQEAIWFGLPGSVAFKHSIDGLAYALLTAGIFGLAVARLRIAGAPGPRPTHPCTAGAHCT